MPLAMMAGRPRSDVVNWMFNCSASVGLESARKGRGGEGNRTEKKRQMFVKLGSYTISRLDDLVKFNMIIN